ncbi:MAG: hypothetical protein O2871_00740 [bacterium]|nr:hypothetical protein [bacterium]
MIEKILRNKNEYQTVFTLSEISTFVGKNSDQNLISALSYYSKVGKLIRLSKGLYALDGNYLIEELANKVRQPSYISLYTILQEKAVVFQVYTSVFSISTRTEELTINKQNFVYRKLKSQILLNNMGIIEEKGVFKARLERALLDKVYLDGDEYFDNLRDVDWGFAKELNKQVYKSEKVQNYIDSYV